MRRLFSTFIFLALIFVLVIFSVSNREFVTVDLFPLSRAIELPVFLLTLGAVFIGVIIGSVLMWFPLTKAHGQRRRAQREIKTLKSRTPPEITASSDEERARFS